MSKPKRIYWKRHLHPFAISWADICLRIETCRSDQKLRLILRATTRPTQTNCWWATAQIAKMIQPMVKAELQRRARTRKAKADMRRKGRK